MTGANKRQQFWQNHLQRYQQSGLSGMKYCNQEQLTYHCFIYWRRKLTGKYEAMAQEPVADAKNTTGFVGVQPLNPAESGRHDALELSLPNGLVIGNIHSGNLGLVSLLLEAL